MAVQSAIKDFTSPILENALETGARGSTTTHTNYGVIGDAMFKKSQLELGIANLQVDMGVKKAQILGGLEMDRARLHLQSADTMMNAAALADQQRAQDVSDTEKILGTVQGAASGAIAGGMVGGLPGAVVGGVAGGGLAYSGYSQGRREGQMAVQTTGMIANAAVAFKSFSDAKKKEDGAKEVMTTVESAKGAMDAATNTQDFESARSNYERVSSGVTSGLVKSGWGIDEAASFSADYGKSQQGIFSLDSEAYNKAKIGKFGDLMRGDKILNSNLPQSYKDSRMKEIFGGIDSSVSQLNNYDPTKQFTADHAQSFANAHGQGANAASLFNPKTPVVSNSIGAVSSVARNSRTAPADQQLQQQTALDPAQTQDAPDIQSSVHMDRGAPMQQGIPFAPSGGNTVSIDEATGVRMFTQPVIAEANLSKQGAQTVKALQDAANEKDRGKWGPNRPVDPAEEARKLRETGLNPSRATELEQEARVEKAKYADAPRSGDKFDMAANKRISELKDETHKQIATVAYKSQDQIEILDIIGYAEMDFPNTEAGEAARTKVEGLAGAAAKVNIIKEQAKSFDEDVKEALRANGVRDEDMDQELRNFYLGLDMYDQGQGSKTEDLAMKGSGFGFTLAADMAPIKGQIGGQGQKFEKNRKLQMEGRGDTQFMGKTPQDLRQRIKDTFNSMTTNMDTFAAEIATGTMKGTLSERDIGMYAVKNPADLSYNTISAKLGEHQTVLVNKLMTNSSRVTKSESRREALELHAQKAQISAGANVRANEQKQIFNQSLKQRPSWLETLQQARRP